MEGKTRSLQAVNFIAADGMATRDFGLNLSKYSGLSTKRVKYVEYLHLYDQYVFKTN